MIPFAFLKPVKSLWPGICLSLFFQTPVFGYLKKDRDFRVEFLNEQTLDKGLTFQGRAVGGLSALTFDEGTGEFLALSDTKTSHRFYRLQLNCRTVKPENRPMEKKKSDKTAFFGFWQKSHTAQGKKLSNLPFDYEPCGQNLSPPFQFVFKKQAFLREKGLKRLRRNMDPEGMGLKGETLFISSEGQQIFPPPDPPQIFVFSNKGVLRKAWPVPSVFWSEKRLSSFGARENKGFESLTLTDKHLWTATEKPLKQDSLLFQAEGKTASPEKSDRPSPRTGHKTRRGEKSRSRRAEGRTNFSLLLRLSGFDLKTGTLLHWYPYFLEPGAGLSEMIAVTDGFFLTLERAYNKQTGKTRVRLFTADCRKASDITVFSSADALSKPQNSKIEKTGASLLKAGRARPVSNGLIGAGTPIASIPCNKSPVFDFDNLPSGVTADNLEGMALGPKLPGGGRLFILVSDNNFNPSQKSQFLFFRLNFPREL